MMESIFLIHLVILSTIHRSGLVPLLSLSTPSIDVNSELYIAGNTHAAGLLIGFL
jgi:hypothetical protein